MPWTRSVDPEEIALFASSEQMPEFARAIRAAGFAGEIAGFYGQYDERFIGGEELVQIPRMSASPEFAQWSRDNSVVIYGRDLGFMAADYYLTIRGQPVAQASPRPGTFDRVMSTISDLAVPAILTAGLAAGVGSLVQAAGASGALATGLTRAGASTLFSVATGAPLDFERIATSAIVAGGGAAAMDWIESAGAVPDLFPSDLVLPELGEGDPFAGGLLDPFAAPEVVPILPTEIELPPFEGPGVELPAFEPLPELPAFEPLPELPAFEPLPELPAFEPLPELPAFEPLPELPTFEPLPELPAFEPLPELPTVQDFEPAFETIDTGASVYEPVEVTGPAFEPVEVIQAPAFEPVEGVDMGDDLSGSILWDPGAMTADDFGWDDVVEVLAPPSDEDWSIEALPPSVFGDPRDLEIVGPPILAPTAPGPVAIPSVVIDTGGVVTVDRIVKTVTNAAVAAIGVVKAWEQRKLPINTTARQTDASGRTVTVAENGTIQIRSQDGRTTVSKPTVGEPRVTQAGNVIVNNGDGTYTKITPDGRRVVLPYTDAAGGVSVGGLNVPPELLYVGIGALVLFAMRGKR